MLYPGYIIEQNNYDQKNVVSIQRQLNKRGCGPLEITGEFNLDTCHATMLFQTRFTDQFGYPLKADGILGPVTLASLFELHEKKLVKTPPNELLASVLELARAQVGITEDEPGSNSGKEISKYQERAGIADGQAWNMAFVYWCFDLASVKLNTVNPLHKTGNVMQGWCGAKGTKINSSVAMMNKDMVLPGQIFIISAGGGHGHAGIVEKNESGFLTTIEGNVGGNYSKSVAGIYRRNRTIDTINVGFIEF